MSSITAVLKSIFKFLIFRNMKSFILASLFLLFSLNSYSQWVEQNSGVTTTFYSVSAIDNNNAWTCGTQSKVIRTTNGGLNWIVVPGNGLPSNYILWNIFAIDANTALTAGDYSPNHIKVFRTSSGGNNWSEVLDIPDGFVDGIWIQSNGNGVMVGDPPTSSGYLMVKKTSNSGLSWYDVSSIYGGIGATGFNNSIYVFGNNVWFGTNSSLRYSTNLGDSWSTQYPSMLPYAIFFQNSSTGMIGGAAGVSQGIKYTTDSGWSWINPTIPGTGSICGLVGNGSTWWCAKFGRNIYRSTNNGVNWVLEYTSQLGTQQHMSKARNGNRMWVVKDSGGIAMSEGLIGISPLSGEIANTFSLFQNYPNPFNPSTKIKFDIPPLKGARGMTARLIIYDALGREIAAPVNEQLNSDSYEIEWDGSNYPSGVYFYRLTAGDYTETKKMILIK
jgi:photosystem II stability/assembly factor-like uncharacterized protein